MLRFVYMCPECRTVYLQKKDEPGRCSICRRATRSLDYTSWDWARFSKPERDAIKNGFHVPRKRARKVSEPDDWIYFLTGFGNEIYVYPNRVVIGRRLFFWKGPYVRKSYPFRSISHVSFQQGSVTSEYGNGFLELGVPERRRGFLGRMGAYLSGTGILFHSVDNDVADEIRHFIESKIGEEKDSPVTIHSQ